MTRGKNLGGLALALLFAAGLFCLLPLKAAFAFSDDEGFEVIKPFMCNKGYTLYKDIWNDQPPVLTVLLSYVFRLFGPTIFTARLVAAGFGLLLAGCVYELVRMRSGLRTALIAVFLLLAAPSVLLLSVSAMLECPAISTALLSALLLFIWGKSGRWEWLAASGAVMGVAMQTKLTAGVIAPAVAMELVLICREKSWGKARPHPGPLPQERETIREGKGKWSQPAGAVKATSKRQGAQNESQGISPSGDPAAPQTAWLKAVIAKGALWGASFLMAFALIGLVWARGALATSWKSHTTAERVPGMDMPKDHKFDPLFIKSHLECLAAVPVAVA